MKRFYALTVISFLVLSLGGCAGLVNDWEILTSAKITPTQVIIAANAFDAIEGTATTYLRLPVCGKFPCRTDAAVRIIVPAIRAGRIARNRLESAVEVGSSAPVDANLFATLVASTNTLKQIIAEYYTGVSP